MISTTAPVLEAPLRPPAPLRALLKTVLIPPSCTDPVRTRKLLRSKSSFTENENL